jgi:hypothetical protein
MRLFQKCVVRSKFDTHVFIIKRQQYNHKCQSKEMNEILPLEILVRSVSNRSVHENGPMNKNKPVTWQYDNVSNRSNYNMTMLVTDLTTIWQC